MIYTKENLELMGDVYCDLKQLKSYKDHAPLQCDIFPFKNITLIIKNAKDLTESQNRKIGKLMDMFSTDDVNELMNTPVPTELRAAFWNGFYKNPNSKN